MYDAIFSDSKGAHSYGFCDIYCLRTGEIWEVKRFGGGYSCSVNAASKQLERYVSGELVHHPGVKLDIGGKQTAIAPDEFYVSDNDGSGYYSIAYWDNGNGIIYYDYYYIPSAEEVLGTAIVAIVAGVFVYAAMCCGGAGLVVLTIA